MVCQEKFYPAINFSPAVRINISREISLQAVNFSERGRGRGSLGPQRELLDEDLSQVVTMLEGGLDDERNYEETLLKKLDPCTRWIGGAIGKMP